MVIFIRITILLEKVPYNNSTKYLVVSAPAGIVTTSFGEGATNFAHFQVM